MINERVWHFGPPPHIGWWNVDTAPIGWLCSGPILAYRSCWWRWWNGVEWSIAVYKHAGSKEAGRAAEIAATNSFEIIWIDYWPENARVGRSFNE